MERSIRRIALLAMVAIHTAIGVSYAQTAAMTGTWSGTTRVTPPCVRRCDAINNVTFAFDQQAPTIKGRYTCATGNRDCRYGGADNAGKSSRDAYPGNSFVFPW